MTPVRRALSIAAVVATLVGLPAVLIAGTLLRHVAHVSPSVQNAAELRLRLLGHDVPCASPLPDPQPAPAASALNCAGPDGLGLRLLAFAGPVEGHPDYPCWYVYGANWRVEVGGDTAASRALAGRLHRALTGRLFGWPPRA